jgi:hypothetical protein
MSCPLAVTVFRKEGPLLRLGGMWNCFDVGIVGGVQPLRSCVAGSRAVSGALVAEAPAMAAQFVGRSLRDFKLAEDRQQFHIGTAVAKCIPVKALDAIGHLS